MRMQSLLLLWAIQLACHKHIGAISSTHTVQGKSSGCKFMERMFGDGHGPFGIGGRSIITINATITPLSDQDVTDTITFHRLREYFDFAIIAISYTNIDRFTHIDEHSICTLNFTDPIHGNVDGLLYGEFHKIEEELSVYVNTEFRPHYSGLQVVMIVPCWKQKQEEFGYPVSTTEYSLYPMRDPLFCVTATIAFRNPYGYLPALLYGMFPFSGCLSLLYGFVDIWLITLINKHRRRPLEVHYLLLLVSLLASGESIAWYITYHSLNTTVQRVCCPYAGAIVVSTILKITAAMLTRVVTTLTCLGFGILRSTISRRELFVVIGLGVSYFISLGGLEISHILHQTDRTTRNSDTRSDAVWEVLVLATNTCFAGCIFTSLALKRKELAEFNQIGHYCRTCKLKRYTVLARVVVGYILLSLFLMSAEGAVFAGTMMLDWQYVWMIWAANRLVMFSALLVVTRAWRPSNIDDDDELNLQYSGGSDSIWNRKDPDTNETRTKR